MSGGVGLVHAVAGTDDDPVAAEDAANTDTVGANC